MTYRTAVSIAIMLAVIALLVLTVTRAPCLLAAILILSTLDPRIARYPVWRK